MTDLSPATLSLNAANKSPIKIDGAFFANMVGASKTEKDVSCKSMIYVSRDVKTLYLSYDTMLDIGIINPGFPTIGEYSTTTQPSLNSHGTITEDVITTSEGTICGATKDDGGICSCPKRTKIPDRPVNLPFPCSAENNKKM